MKLLDFGLLQVAAYDHTKTVELKVFVTPTIKNMMLGKMRDNNFQFVEFRNRIYATAELESYKLELTITVVTEEKKEV